MNPWLLGLGLVVVEATLLICAWQARKAWKQYRRLEVEALWQRNIEEHRLTRGKIDHYLNQPKPPEPETGAFLPSDEDAARMEKMLLASEDRFIGGRPTPSSSGRIAPSPTTSRTASSTPRPRNSGSA